MARKKEKTQGEGLPGARQRRPCSAQAMQDQAMQDQAMQDQAMPLHTPLHTMPEKPSSYKG